MSSRFKNPALPRMFRGLALLLAGAAGAQTPPGFHIRGDIVSRTSDSLTIHRRNGDTVTVTCKADVLISSLGRAQLSDIKAGSFVGTAARADLNGNLIAQQVFVFPKSTRGIAEGHYEWDLGPQSSMINAKVDAVIERAGGIDLRLSHSGGGSDAVMVPPNTPIVVLIAATRADLIAGRRIFAIGFLDAPNRYVMQRIVIEKDGVVPAM